MALDLMSGRRVVGYSVLVFVGLVLVATGCSSGTSATSGTQTEALPAGGVHALRPPWSEEVAEGIPLHVEATVLSREVMRKIDDPYWPLKDDPMYRNRFGGTWIAAWNLKVVELFKGVSTEEIRVIKAVDHQPREPGDEPAIGEYDFVEPGGTYVFYLGLRGLAEGFRDGDEEKVEEIERNLTAHRPYRHWLLGHVERVEEATFPGAGAHEE